jgi:hypothetical protein
MDYIMSSGRMTVYDELARMWNEVVITYYMALSLIFSGGTKEYSSQNNQSWAKNHIWYLLNKEQECNIQC